MVGHKYKAGLAPRRSLPARGAKTTAIAGLAKVTKTENTPIAEDDEPVKGAKETRTKLPDAKPVTKYIPLAPEEALEVFTTFETNANLEGGVCIIQRTGNGQFVLVNLSTVADGALGSKQTGVQLMEDKALMAMLKIKDKVWDDARVKCSQAIMSARGQIFRFFNLPLELREMVYALCFRSREKLTAGMGPTELNLAFLRTSRTVYEESVQFFRQNTFYVDSPTPALNGLTKGSNENVRILSIEVQGAYMKDQEVFAFVAACSNLKEVHVKYTARCQYSHRVTPQRLHGNEAQLARFRRTTGFDILCTLRGLEKVVITFDPVPASHHPHARPITEADRAAFEAFLMVETTKPAKTKAQLEAEEKAVKKALAENQRQLEKARKAKKNKARRGRGRKVPTNNDDDSDDEYDGTSRSWAH